MLLLPLPSHFFLPEWRRRASKVIHIISFMSSRDRKREREKKEKSMRRIWIPLFSFFFLLGRNWDKVKALFVPSLVAFTMAFSLDPMTDSVRANIWSFLSFPAASKKWKSIGFSFFPAESSVFSNCYQGRGKEDEQQNEPLLSVICVEDKQTHSLNGR